VTEVVFLHAGVADERSWPGEGLAYRRSGSVDPVDELFAVLDEHHLDRVVLVGHSVGGRIALDAALQDPARVRGMYLIAPSVSGAPQPDRLPPAVSEIVDVLDAAEEAGALDEVNTLEARLWLDGPLSPEGRVGGEVRALFLDMNGAALHAPDAVAERPRADAWDRLSTLDVPAHVVVGALDLPHIVLRARALAARLPTCSVEVMADVAHLPPLERPTEVVASLDRFLATLR